MSLEDFEFHRDTQIVFGKGLVKEQLGDLLINHGAKRVLLAYGRSSIRKIGLYDEVVGIMKERGIEFWELNGIRPNPEVGKVREGVKIVRENNIDFILAVGGGSVLDASKAISAGHAYEGDVWEIIHNYWRKDEDKKEIKITKFLRIGTILTLSATGSEFNIGCVISNDEEGKKLAYFAKENLPKFSILDPTYTFSVSPYQTRAGSFDILSHVLEIYFGTSNTFFTQRMCEAAIMTVMEYLPKALADPESYEARSNLMWASSVALSGLLQNGRKDRGDWSNHQIEHEVAAIKIELPHGIGLAIITMGWMRYVCEKKPERFIQLGRRCFGMRDVTNAKEVVDYFEGYLEKNGFPLYFADEESTKDWNEQDSIKAARTRFEHFQGETVGNYIPLKEPEVISILNSRIRKKD